jgi:glycosyltransferase involved in cell wall biosynthesis
MKKRKIALVYDAIYPYVKGGAEKRYADLARQLVKKGFEVHCYGMKYWQGPKVIKHNGVYLHGICRAWPLYGKNGKRSLIGALWFGMACLKLVREEFDYMDCCAIPFTSLITCRLVTWAKRKRLYSTWHEVWGKEYWLATAGWSGWLGCLAEKLALRLPDEFIVVSEHTAQALAAQYKTSKPVHVVENGIDSDWIRTIPAARKPSDLIYVGRLAYNKNIDVLIDAVGMLKAQYPGIRLTVIGDGPERLDLEQLVMRQGLSKNVIFAGAVEREAEVIGAMKASKVFVLPSSREGFGIVVIEAHAAGIPVVTVDAKANAARRLITDENGLVARLNAPALARAISMLLSRRPNRKACAASAERYDWPALAEKYKAVFL